MYLASYCAPFFLCIFYRKLRNDSNNDDNDDADSCICTKFEFVSGTSLALRVNYSDTKPGKRERETDILRERERDSASKKKIDISESDSFGVALQTRRAWRFFNAIAYISAYIYLYRETHTPIEVVGRKLSQDNILGARGRLLLAPNNIRSTSSHRSVFRCIRVLEHEPKCCIYKYAYILGSLHLLCICFMYNEKL